MKQINKYSFVATRKNDLSKNSIKNTSYRKILWQKARTRPRYKSYDLGICYLNLLVEYQIIVQENVYCENHPTWNYLQNVTRKFKTSLLKIRTKNLYTSMVELLRRKPEMQFEKFYLNKLFINQTKHVFCEAIKM